MSEGISGPTGPNEMWVEGDHYHNGMICMDLTADQAALLNKQTAEIKEKMAAAELSRQAFDMHRVCVKCGCVFPAKIGYCAEGAHCSQWHGFSEHFDRKCRRCGYLWAENLV